MKQFSKILLGVAAAGIGIAAAVIVLPRLVGGAGALSAPMTGGHGVLPPAPLQTPARPPPATGFQRTVGDVAAGLDLASRIGKYIDSLGLGSSDGQSAIPAPAVPDDQLGI